ncbi:hypothetical protein B0T20DRAFT_465539 [Sordaria brevicollis]|uniref:Uncharacterized protein n=1 Tax=Sordaria brevicollis TaxID=83679 RepID=A0AAE0PM90_SORBR|nr:hypothetical protein B0T20DRAFT_465539 [Sordaria brevicollis]
MGVSRGVSPSHWNPGTIVALGLVNVTAESLGRGIVVLVELSSFVQAVEAPGGCKDQVGGNPSDLGEGIECREVLSGSDSSEDIMGIGGGAHFDVHLDGTITSAGAGAGAGSVAVHYNTGASDVGHFGHGGSKKGDTTDCMYLCVGHSNDLHWRKPARHPKPNILRLMHLLKAFNAVETPFDVFCFLLFGSVLHQGTT